MKREYMPITITTTHRPLGEDLVRRIRPFGYKVRLNVVTECTHHVFLAGTGLSGEIEEIGIVREAIAPLTHRQVVFDPDIEEIGMEIMLGSDRPSIRNGIELYCPANKQPTVLQRAVSYNLEVTPMREEHVTRPVLRFRDGDLFHAGLLAWQLGMPEETRLIHDQSLQCAVVAAIPDDEQLTRLRRQKEAVSIRCSNANAARDYEEHLTRLGYTIRYNLVDKQGLHGAFGLNLGCYHARTIEHPSFQRELQDLLRTTTEWMQQHGIDTDAYPFEVKDRNRCFQPIDMNSIVIDLPWNEREQNKLVPYGKGHVGRYRCEIQAASSQSANVLADNFAEQIFLDRPGINILKMEDRLELVFGRRIMDDRSAQQAYRVALAEALGMAVEDIPIRYDLNDVIDVMVHLPARAPRAQEELSVLVRSNEAFVVDRISDTLEARGYCVHRVYDTNPHPFQVACRIGKLATYREAEPALNLLRPLQFEIEPRNESEQHDLELNIHIDLTDRERTVALLAPSRTLVDDMHRRLSRHRFGVISTGMESSAHPVVYHSRFRPDLAGYVAWLAGMPPDTEFVMKTGLHAATLCMHCDEAENSGITAG